MQTQDPEMKEIYRELGVDIPLHDQMISNLNNLHQKTHLSQKKRPDAMKRFDEAFHESHIGRVKEIYDYRQKGGKSIGTFCIYVPDEIAMAADVIPIPLCGGSGWSVSYADKLLPRDICPLIRSTFGMSLSQTCPFKKLKDFAVGETTCDAKKKAWDLFSFKVLEVPQKKNKIDKQLWLEEVYAFKDMCEELSGVKITEESLHDSIALLNKKREMLQLINEFRKLHVPPISGVDALLVSQTAIVQSPLSFIKNAEYLLDELEDRAKKGIPAYEKIKKRVMIAGTPSPLGFAKIHHLLESAGLAVVYDESCTGARYYRDLIDDQNASLDEMIKSIADRYFKIDCACFSPNTERIDNLKKAAKDFNVDGVINFVLQYCHGYNIESKAVESAFKKINIPSLKIETDYSQEDSAQIMTRIQAFTEMLGG